MSEVMYIKKAGDEVNIPRKGTDLSAGYDMYAYLDEPVTIQPGESAMIRSGVTVAIPEGYAAFIFARSGLSCKQGLRPSTCVSVIDEDYRGEIGLPMYNDSKEPRIIVPNERIAQMVLIKVFHPDIEVVESLDDTSRGTGGFGSTGKE